MLRMTVIDLPRDRRDDTFGSERELAEALRNRFGMPSGNLDELVKALNATDEVQVVVKPYEPGPEQNRLPEGYQDAHQEDEPDPWPRRGEQPE